MQTLTLKALQFHARHGVYEEERIDGNNFEVDLIIKTPLRKAGQSDKLEDTIDYQRLQEKVASVMKGPSVRLIETLAQNIGENIYSEMGEIEHLEVAVRKLSPPLDVATAYSEIRMTWPR